MMNDQELFFFKQIYIFEVVVVSSNALNNSSYYHTVQPCIVRAYNGMSRSCLVLMCDVDSITKDTCVIRLTAKALEKTAISDSFVTRKKRNLFRGHSSEPSVLPFSH